MFSMHEAKQRFAGSVLKIEVTKQAIPYKTPFSMPEVLSVSGSGWVVDLKELLQCNIPLFGEEPQFTADDEWLDKRLQLLGVPKTEKGQFLVIVTNAHVTQGFCSGSYRIENNPTVHVTNLLVAFSDRDLALLLPNPSSVDLLTPCSISAQYVEPGYALAAYGYPNGTVKCFSAGNLKRALCVPFAHSSMVTLAYEMTCAINGGDSGGPVVHEGNVVAITHQHTNGRSQSHAIPLAHLIAAVRDFVIHKRDVGMCAFPLDFNALLSPEIRKFYKLNPIDGQGVIVSKTSKQHEPFFKVGDILFKINDLNIDSEGTIKFGQQQIPLGVYMHLSSFGSLMQFNLLRDGVLEDINLRLTTPIRCIDIIPYAPPIKAPLALYRHGFGFVQLHMGMERACSTVDGKIMLSRSLATAMSSNGFKRPDLQGKVYVILMSSMAEGYASRDAKLCVFKINEIAVRDIWHVQQILNNPRFEHDEYVRVYCSADSDIPTFVLPRLTHEQDVAHCKQFGISLEFLSLPKSKLAQTEWDLLRVLVKKGFFKTKVSAPEIDEQKLQGLQVVAS